jgi:chitodextrinase
MRYRRSPTTLALIVVSATATVLALPLPAQARDRTAPTIPQGLRVTATSDSSVDLAWSASSDSSGSVTYRVYLDAARQGDASQPTHVQGGLASSTSYTFTVRAVDRYGNVSQASSPLSASTTGGGHATPGTPVNLRVTGADYDSVDLAWDAPAGASVGYYLIYRNGLWVNSSYGTTGSVDYLAAGTAHTFEVIARGTDNSLSAPAAITASTRADAGPPTVPGNLRVQTNAQGLPTGLVWDPSTDDRGVSNYWLFADGSDAFGGGVGVSFYSLTDEYCTVFRGQTYTFTVRARDLSGNLSSTGTPLTVTVP